MFSSWFLSFSSISSTLWNNQFLKDLVWIQSVIRVCVCVCGSKFLFTSLCIPYIEFVRPFVSYLYVLSFFPCVIFELLTLLVAQPCEFPYKPSDREEISPVANTLTLSNVIFMKNTKCRLVHVKISRGKQIPCVAWIFKKNRFHPPDPLFVALTFPYHVHYFYYL